MIHTEYVPPWTDDDLPEVVTLTYEAAEFLASIPVRAIGTDAFSFASLTDQSPVAAQSEVARTVPAHYAFLSRGFLPTQRLFDFFPWDISIPRIS